MRILGLGMTGGDRQLMLEDQDCGAGAGGRPFRTLGQASGGIPAEMSNCAPGTVVELIGSAPSGSHRPTDVHPKSASVWVVWYAVFGDGTLSSLGRSLAT